MAPAPHGGVVNIVLRREFEASQAEVTVEQLQGANANTVNAQFMAGQRFGSKLSISVSGGYAVIEPVLLEDQDLGHTGKTDDQHEQPGLLGLVNHSRSVRPHQYPNWPMIRTFARQIRGQSLSSPRITIDSKASPPICANAGKYALDLPSTDHWSQGWAALRTSPPLKSWPISSEWLASTSRTL